MMRLREVLQILALAVVYFLAARFGLSLASATEQVTAVWPPTGIALAALLIFGYRIAPGIAIGAFAANLLTNEPPLVALAIAFGNTLEALTGAYLLKRYAGFHTAMDRVRDVFWFLICAVLFSTMVSASIGVISLSVGGIIPWASFGSVWFVWWIGDLMGGFIFTPFLLVLWNARNDLPRIRKNWIEATLLALVVGISNYVIFINTYDGSWISYIRAYHVFIVLIWAAIRFGQIGAVIASFTTMAFAIWGTTLHTGPFSQGANTEENLILLQFYLFAVTFTAQFMGAAMSERNRTQESLIKANEGLEVTVRERTSILENALTEQKQAEEAVSARSRDLERLNKSMVGRELKMVELKKEIEELKKKTGRA